MSLPVFRAVNSGGTGDTNETEKSHGTDAANYELRKKHDYHRKYMIIAEKVYDYHKYMIIIYGYLQMMYDYHYQEPEVRWRQRSHGKT